MPRWPRLPVKTPLPPGEVSPPKEDLRAMLVQIYEIQNAAEARALEAVGVDHIGVLVGQGRYARELRPAQARRIFDAITRARKVALSLADDLEEVSEVMAQTVPDILHRGGDLENPVSRPQADAHDP